MTITEFLLARIADDEQDAGAIQHDIDRWRRETAINGADGSQGSITVTGIFGTASDPARVLAECEAKRRIVADCGEYEGPETDGLSAAHARFTASPPSMPTTRTTGRSGPTRRVGRVVLDRLVGSGSDSASVGEVSPDAAHLCHSQAEVMAT